MDLKIFNYLKSVKSRLDKIEKQVQQIDSKFERSLSALKRQVIRINSGEKMSNLSIASGGTYLDLHPARAYEIFNDPQAVFQLLDCSRKSYKAPTESLGECLKIPLEELSDRYQEISGRLTTPLMVISERGLDSIIACEILAEKGLYIVNNISGGHQFWPGHAS